MSIETKKEDEANDNLKGCPSGLFFSCFGVSMEFDDLFIILIYRIETSLAGKAEICKGCPG
jgi:hypothetical protein